MRETKLFSIGIENKAVAENLKKELSNLKIEEDGRPYKGFISCDIIQQNGEIELLVYTYLNLEEFNELIFRNVEFPKIFQYEKKEIIV